jgi:hypothetical protein
MRDPFGAAAPTIFAAFADPEPIIYTQAGVVVGPIRAIRSDDAAPNFQGPGASLRKVTYEVRKRDLPAEPTKRDTFTHRRRKWSITERISLDELDAWQLIVTDVGAVS